MVDKQVLIIDEVSQSLNNSINSYVKNLLVIYKRNS